MATCTSQKSGDWDGAGVWDTAPISGNGDKIIIAAGHNVTYNQTSGEFGHDASNLTASSNSIVVNGTLSFDQTKTTELTCKGTLCVANGGKITCGTSASPLPSSYTCTIKCNYSASMGSGKHALFGTGATGTWELNGTPRTRNTALTSGISAGATSITVDASTGWAVGDTLVIASDTNDATRAQTVTISAGSSPTWTVSAITNARSAGCLVGNLSSNVIIKAHTAANPGIFYIAHTTPTISISDVRFENIGSGSGWWRSGGSGANLEGYGTSIVVPTTTTPQSVTSCAFEGTNAAHYGAIEIKGLSNHLTSGFSDCAIYTIGTSGTALIFQSSLGTFDSIVCYRAALSYRSSMSYDTRINNSTFYVSSNLGDCRNSATATFDACAFYAGAQALAYAGDIMRFNSCTLDVQTRLLTQATSPQFNWIGSYVLKNCTYQSAALSGSLTSGATAPGQAMTVMDIAVDGVATDNRVRSYWQNTVTDTTTRNRSTYAVKMQVRVANTATYYTFTLPVVSGVEQTIIGALRWDDAYDTTSLTKPTIALSGQGVSETFTPAGSSIDTWYPFTFTFTPTSTGDVTATLTAQSTVTTGYVWLDGIYHYPMTQSVRHYGYQFLEQTALEVDADVVETTEATVLAYGVSVNHGTNTITVTSSATTVQIADYLVADLCQTANQSEAVHYTRNVGGDFTTSYAVVVNTGVTVTGNFTTTGTVTLNGTGTVVGVYTSSGGTNTKLTLTGLSAAAVEIFDELGAHYAYTASVTGTYTLYLPHTETGNWSWKVAKYGYLAAEGTFAAGTGAVTAAPSLSTDTGITQGTVATVIAYTDLLNLDRQYDYLAYWETTSTGIMFDRLAVKNGDSIDFGALNVTFDSTAVAMVTYAAPALTLKAGTVVVGSTFTEFETSGTFTLAGASTYAAPAIWTDSGGRHVYVTAANIVSGSRVQIYNVTNSVEVYNGALGGAGLSYGVVYTADKTFRLRADHADKLPLEVTGTLTRLGVTWLDSQDDDTVYTDNAIDGSTCTEFAADLPNIHIDVSDPDGETSVQRLYAWAQYYQTTSAGIASDFFGSVTAFDSVNYTIDETRADIKLDNIGGSPVRIIGGYLTRSDGSTIIAATSGSIQMDPGKAYLAGAASIADGVLAAEVWTGYSLKRTTRIIAAAVAGKVSGGPGSPVFRNLPDDADQVSGTADANGNRTAATYGA